MELFRTEQVAGVFRGFREGGLEFHAELAIPYRSDLHTMPMHGQFILVQLETPEEAVLGRIASFSSEGRLSFGEGEEFNIRAVRDARPVPEDLREQYLKYRVSIRVLGVLRNGAGNRLDFVPSHRRLPHVGAPVAFLSDEVLQSVVGHDDDGAAIGHFALGEYIYDPDRGRREYTAPWMRLRSPEAKVHFDIRELVSRRTFIFARAGFGKSNLNKLLFSELYRNKPATRKRDSREVPVGTVLFDPDGEYFWPDDKGRPGLCDVPHLVERLVVFTSRTAPSRHYEAFTAGKVKLDIRELRPSDVVSIALDAERQQQQNVIKLRQRRAEQWKDLVDLIYSAGHDAPLQDVAKLLGVDEKTQQAEAVAARSNMNTIVAMLHDPSSQMMDLLMQALKDGKLCVVDISQMRGEQGFALAGIILRKIFAHNQDEFIKAQPQTIPTIAVIEEAQSVLNDRAGSSEPFIAWVKEGRKYDLGAVLVTQQPGSIPNEILSQGDNWFLFHLLSAGDLGNLKKANAHFSDDILSSLLNEPIVGQGVFWSSAKNDRAYPISLRIRSFEQQYLPCDPDRGESPPATYAASLREQASAMERVAHELGAEHSPTTDEEGEERPSVPDIKGAKEKIAVEAIRNDDGAMKWFDEDGVFWGRLISTIEDEFGRREMEHLQSDAKRLVRPVLLEIFGNENEGWHSFKDEKGRLRVKKGPPPE